MCHLRSLAEEWGWGGRGHGYCKARVTSQETKKKGAWNSLVEGEYTLYSVCVCTVKCISNYLDLWLFYTISLPFWDVLLLFLGQNVHAYSWQQEAVVKFLCLQVVKDLVDTITKDWRDLFLVGKKDYRSKIRAYK